MSRYATRASLDELLEFANQVREAGGGAVLDALMPARPADAKQCLIAKNLNFNCSVSGGYGPNEDSWGMETYSPQLAQRIAGELGLEITGVSVVLLPDEIGQVARDFDSFWDEDIDTLKMYYQDYLYYREHPDEFPDELPESFDEYLDSTGDLLDFENIKEFWPYVEASLKQSSELGFLNEKGELLL